MFRVREVIGWLLVVFGVYLMLLALGSLGSRQVIEGGMLTMVGIVVFRGGIHLIKVATAARVVLAARRDQRSRRSAIDQGPVAAYPAEDGAKRS